MRTRLSCRIPAGSVLSILFVVSGTLFQASAGHASELKVQRIRIDTTPAGATINTIAGKRGFTPLTITERDIYPNTYPRDKVDLYGKVVITKVGCKTITRRITLDDIKRGIDIKLDCTAATPVIRPETAREQQPPRIYAEPTTPIPEPVSRRHLRQLKVLDELLDDKLISAEEEQAIRKRIFERLDL